MSLPSILNRTNYSFLYSALTVEEIISYAAENKHKYVVVSDFQNSYSWAKFFKEARKHNLIPVFGIQINYKNSSLLFLAKNKFGYRELLKISRYKNLNNVDFQNLIFIHLEGEDNFPDTFKYFANVENENGIYVRENKFLKDSDFDFYCLLRAIGNRSTIFQEMKFNVLYTKDYLYFSEYEKFKNSQQIKNLNLVLSQFENYDILPHQNTLDFFSNPAEILKNFLENVFENFSKNLNVHLIDKYKNRLFKEFQVLVDKGFCAYFLVVYDAINWARNQKIYIGPGRGSVCGSLVAYVMGITEIDPIEYDLYFERFLNVSRATIPDIDIDIASNRRQELLLYLREKYGENHVAFAPVFKNFKIKNSIKEVLQAYSINKQEMEFYSKILNQEEVKDVKKFISGVVSRKHPQVANHLLKIQNYPQSFSIHASGVIISSLPITDLVPVEVFVGFPLIIAQWEIGDLEEMGFVKFDFLSSNSLCILRNMENQINKLNDKTLDWKFIDLSDPKVYEVLTLGFNVNIFQFESYKFKLLISKFKPSSIMDLALISSINRPGVSDQINLLLSRKNSGNFKNYYSKSIILEPLNSTYGILVYQEQLMKMISIVTGCSPGQSDIFRRAISEGESNIAALKKWFFHNASEKFSESELNSAWQYIVRFAKYGFNKSHAVAYAIVSYRFMWIKTYYPEIFYPISLSHSFSADCLNEIESRGYQIAGPTYGKSDYSDFVALNKCFYFPISRIVGINLSIQQYEAIPFKKTVAKEAIEELIVCSISLDSIRKLLRVGFFDSLFSTGENALFFDENLDIIWNNVVYGMSLDMKDVQFNEASRKKYREYKRQLLGLEFDIVKIPESIFENRTNLNRIKNLSFQAPETTSTYIGFAIYIQGSENKNMEVLYIKISDGFFVSNKMAFRAPPQELSKWNILLKKNQTPVIVDIFKDSDFNYRIKNMKEIK